MLLDQAIPKWEFRAHYHLRLQSDPPNVMQAVHDVTWGEATTFRYLVLNHFGGRRLHKQETILERFLDTPFQILAESDHELVIGCILARSRGISIPEQCSLDDYRAFSTPGCWKESMNFHFSNGVLTTETRVQTLDPLIHHLFFVYWTLIRMPSGLIRQAWLQAIKQRVINAGQPKKQPITRTEGTT